MEINDVMLKEYEDFAIHAFNKLNGKIGGHRFINIDTYTKHIDAIILYFDLEELLKTTLEGYGDVDTIDELKFDIEYNIILKIIRLTLFAKYDTYKFVKDLMGHTDFANIDDEDKKTNEVRVILDEFLSSETFKYAYELRDFIDNEVIDSKYTIQNNYFINHIKESPYFNLIEKRPLYKYYTDVLQYSDVCLDYERKEKTKRYSNIQNILDDNSRKVVLILKSKTGRKRLVLIDKDRVYNHVKEYCDYLIKYSKEGTTAHITTMYSVKHKLIVVFYKPLSGQN